MCEHVHHVAYGVADMDEAARAFRDPYPDDHLAEAEENRGDMS